MPDRDHRDGGGAEPGLPSLPALPDLPATPGGDRPAPPPPVSLDKVDVDHTEEGTPDGTAPPPHWDQVAPGADRWPGAPALPPPPHHDAPAAEPWTTTPFPAEGPRYPRPYGFGPPPGIRRSRRVVLVTVPIVVAAIVIGIVVAAVAGTSRHGLSRFGGSAAPINEDVLFDPTHPTTVNGRSYHVVGVDQTRNCAADVTASFAAVLAHHGCRAILRGLFVDGAGDIVVAEDIIVLADAADAGAVGDAANQGSSIAVHSFPAPLSAIHAYPGGTAALPAAPAAAGAAGAVQSSDPAQAPGGAVFGAQTQNQFVSFNVGAYVDGRQATTGDPRLQRATGDVRYAVLDPILAISFDQDATDGALKISLGF